MDNPALPHGHNRVTISHIADAVGVSRITVSRALRNSDLVKAALRERIQDTAAAMGYRINLAARDLRLRQHRRIAVVIDMAPSAARPMFDPYPLALLGGIVQECASAGFAVILTTSDPQMSPEIQDARGIILLGQGADHHAVHGLSSLALPLAVWGADDGVEAQLGAVVVGSDNRLGGALAATHLLDRGATRLVFLGDTRHAEVADRFTGFSARLAGSAGRLVAQEACDFTSDGGRAAMAEVLAGGTRFDGVFAGSDLMAIGAMQAMRAAGFEPGRDIGVVGYDDSPAAAAHQPPLSSIHQNWTAGGQLLAAALLTTLDSALYPAPPSRVLQTELVARAT